MADKDPWTTHDWGAAKWWLGCRPSQLFPMSTTTSREWSNESLLWKPNLPITQGFAKNLRYSPSSQTASVHTRKFDFYHTFDHMKFVYTVSSTISSKNFSAKRRWQVKWIKQQLSGRRHTVSINSAEKTKRNLYFERPSLIRKRRKRNLQKVQFL